LENFVEGAYGEISSKTLEYLISNMNLLTHLTALRKYLFLLQGDFATYLLETIAPELSKPASALYRHSLLGVLDSVTRSIESQEDEDNIKRLDVRLLEVR
jgi:gamma-tubulin complex component 3